MNKYEPDMDNPDDTGHTSGGAKSTSGLPLPSLKDTAEHFTTWFTPFLSNEQRAKTRTALNVFVKPDGLGVRLHEKLKQVQEQAEEKSWLHDFWTDRFLGKRDPIAINDNYFFLFRASEMPRTKHAAALIAAALNYKLVLDTNQIPLAVE